MEINLVLAPEQSPATLLEMQAAHPQNFFYLGKVSQLSGTNLLIVGEPALVQQFKRPMPLTVASLMENCTVILSIKLRSKVRNITMN